MTSSVRCYLSDNPKKKCTWRQKNDYFYALYNSYPSECNDESPSRCGKRSISGNSAVRNTEPNKFKKYRLRRRERKDVVSFSMTGEQLRAIIWCFNEWFLTASGWRRINWRKSTKFAHSRAHVIFYPSTKIHYDRFIRFWNHEGNNTLTHWHTHTHTDTLTHTLEQK